ncbi:hypothetical protein BZG36_05526 [Bifiguratus adelaidae]|uniref:GH16 domain-containing protein n=1 Tax=Bifiguratus adelaidae TaxID=1938954 RepID=A0A261XTL4_9FUNG|nr:hypothetical protein BZG36_05526 [Bifiguratus adelaidae]
MESTETIVMSTIMSRTLTQRSTASSRSLAQARHQRILETPDKPWLQKKRPGQRWLTIIPVTGIIIAFAVGGVICYLGIASMPNNKYCLVLDDDFSTLNTSIWSHEIQLGGFGNGEFEWTTDSSNNSYVSNGVLHIVPTLTEDVIGVGNLLNGYTLNLTGCTGTMWSDCMRTSNSTNGTIINPVQSARLTTRNSVSINRGKIEIVAKFPKGDWLWPAIWLLPKNNVYGPWPASGEIDLAESRGNTRTYSPFGNNVFGSTLHWGPSSDLDSWYMTTNTYSNQHSDYTQDYHTFGLEWTDTYIMTWVDSPLRQNLYVDLTKDFWSRGNFPLSYQNGSAIVNPWSSTGSPATPFDQEFYLLLDVAVGGTNGWFPDSLNKPWVDNSPIAQLEFYNNKDKWLPTWGAGEASGLSVQSVKMWQLSTTAEVDPFRSEDEDGIIESVGSVTNEEGEYESTEKYDLMAEHLYTACRSKGYFNANHKIGCVTLRISRGNNVFYPATTNDVFREVVSAFNVEVTIKMSSKIVKSVFKSLPLDARDVLLRDGMKIQVLDSARHLLRARKHQWAAFIREDQTLILWGDSFDGILDVAEVMEKKLVQLIWSGIPKEAMEEVAEKERDLESLYTQQRPYMFITSLANTFAAMTVIILLCNGLRALLVEWYIDGDWTRFFIMLTCPMLALATQFLPQAFFGSLFAMIGPLWQVNENTMFYSGKPPRNRLSGENLPHITVQVPVYKESLNGVIDPTIQSIKAAITTYELQGGTVNIFVNDDGMQLLNERDRRIRQQYYTNHSIGWVARPPHGHNGFIRGGRFKKASNMNFALNISTKIEEALEAIRDPSWTDEDEAIAYEWTLNAVIEQDGRAWAAGNIRVGELILLLDSDSRVPEDCFLDAATEMTQNPEVAIIQHSSGVMLVVHNYWEHGIAWFTRMVYHAIRIAVAGGDVAAFVGHNAFLRWSAMREVAFEEDGVRKIWSESHVSEDFDMSLRLQIAGYISRYATYSNNMFKEGVSLTVYDEITRWQKYAYGCSELIFHPLYKWIYKGPFTPLFRKFLFSNMMLHSKIGILGYVGSYYAIACSIWLTILGYFLSGWWAYAIDHFYITNFEVLFATLCAFPLFGNVALSVIRYRLKEMSLLGAFFDTAKWIPFFAIFFGGLSFHVSLALMAHLVGYNMQWGATAKELEESNFFREVPKVIKGYKFMYLFMIAIIAGMCCLAFVVPVEWSITKVTVVVPLVLSVSSHVLLPLALNPFLMNFTY